MTFEISHHNYQFHEIQNKFFMALLPEQGSIEIQQDMPNKYHSWHYHKTSETIIMLKGALTFYCNDREFDCDSSSVITLPCELKHASRAHEDGAVYLILKEIKWIS